MSTLLAILTFAAETGAEHEETSKTPFYIAGGALAVWAVLVSALGITKHDFPSSNGAARGVMGLTALLVVAVMATSIATG